MEKRYTTKKKFFKYVIPVVDKVLINNVCINAKCTDDDSFECEDCILNRLFDIDKD